MKKIIYAFCVAVMFVNCYRDSSDFWAERMPHVGADAPQFELLAHDSTKIQINNLKKRSVLYFLSVESMSTDSLSFCGFRTNMTEIDSLRAKVFIVTDESPAANKQIRQNYSIPFTLLSDTDKTVCNTYGVLEDDGSIHPALFIFDECGKVHAVFPVFNPRQQFQDVMRILRLMSDNGRTMFSA